MSSASFQPILKSLHTSLGPDPWLHVLSCAVSYPRSHFELATRQLIEHPEWNSGLILRAEEVQCSPWESTLADARLAKIPRLEGLRPIQTMHRRLLPRRPGRDAPLEQLCTYYSLEFGSSTDTPCSGHPTGGADEPSVLVLTPLVPPNGEIPYYHPRVQHLAFRYLESCTTDVNTVNGTYASAYEGKSSPFRGEDPHSALSATLSIEYLPLPSSPSVVRLLESDRSASEVKDQRLFRTAQSLLSTLHRFKVDYTKRVHHDVLVEREQYQDTYLLLRERHGDRVKEWVEATEPGKHVFEDISIATYLMLLWADTFPAPHTIMDSSEDEGGKAPWKKWGRPPGGFIDLGCGNGLLTHILLSEGYHGHGFDVRARASWATYPQHTRDSLVVCGIDPREVPGALLSPAESKNGRLAVPSDRKDGSRIDYDRLLPPHAFYIANHADELTPWTPLLATRRRASGYLSIPCCSWAFDKRFQRRTSTAGEGGGWPGEGWSWGEAVFAEDTEDHKATRAISRYAASDSRALSEDDHPSSAGPATVGTEVGEPDATRRRDTAQMTEAEFAARLNLGTDTRSQSSAYAAYRVWISALSAYFGWAIETDVLRIPSTRNWAIAGRQRTLDDETAQSRVEKVIATLKDRGAFKVRIPEGKAGMH